MNNRGPTIINVSEPNYSSSSSGMNCCCCKCCTCIHLRFLKTPPGLLKIAEFLIAGFCQSLMLEYASSYSSTLGISYQGYLTTASTCWLITGMLLFCYIISEISYKRIRQSILEVVFNITAACMYVSSSSYLAFAMKTYLYPLHFQIYPIMSFAYTLGGVVAVIHAYDAYQSYKHYKDEIYPLVKWASKNYIRINVANMAAIKNVRFSVTYYNVGYLVDVLCPGVFGIVKQASKLDKFSYLFNWIFLQPRNKNSSQIISKEVCNEKFSDFGQQVLSNASILPNSQVQWIQPSCLDDNYSVFEVYRTIQGQELISTLIGIYPKSNFETILLSMKPLLRRRKNLKNIVLKGAYVVQFPELFTYMDDIKKRDVDPFTKWNYPLVSAVAEDLNFKPHLLTTDNFGWTNGSGIFDGLMGMLQRHELHFGMLGVLMRTDRIPIIDFTGETIQIETKVIFRQPPLSSVNNIFVLPFDSLVWTCCLGLCVFSGISVLLHFILYKYINQSEDEVQIDDIITLITGAICQQGFYISPASTSSRITILCVFISSLFLYTSYSANIVALLQSPSSAIKTLIDLINSPLNVGMQNITYNKVFLEENDNTNIKRLYQNKIKPRGNASILNPREGLKLVQQGMFAFQVDTAAGYDIISNTFTDSEKCSLSEVITYELPMQTVPVAKKSPYRDLFTISLRWIREVGILDRTSKRWVPHKPVCESNHIGFNSVGLIEVMPAIRFLSIGVACSVLIFIVECFIKWYKNKNRIVKQFKLYKVYKS